MNIDKTESANSKIIMYHDGECPLCKFEVKTMKKLDKAKNIRWVDISKDKEALRKANLSYHQTMARVHVRNKDQQMLTGIRGFMVVWEQLPYYRRIVPVIKHTPFLLTIMESIYTLFAKYRLLLTGKKPLASTLKTNKKEA